MTCADTDITGKELEHRLDEVYITANKNTVPNDPQKPFVTSGVRIGTPAVTTRGFGPEEMRKIAKWIAACTFDFEAQEGSRRRRGSRPDGPFPAVRVTTARRQKKSSGCGGKPGPELFIKEQTTVKV